MSWSPSVFKKLTNKDCRDFLLSYMKNKTQNPNLSNAYRDVLHYIVGSIMITDDFRIISKSAKIILSKNNITKPNTSKSYKKDYGLILEHTIPISCITDYLMQLDQSEYSQEKFQKLINLIRGIALITIEEDQLLTSNNLKSALPKGCSIDSLLDTNSSSSFDVRYKFVGIEY